MVTSGHLEELPNKEECAEKLKHCNIVTQIDFLVTHQFLTVVIEMIITTGADHHVLRLVLKYAVAKQQLTQHKRYDNRGGRPTLPQRVKYLYFSLTERRRIC